MEMTFAAYAPFPSYRLVHTRTEQPAPRPVPPLTAQEMQAHMNGAGVVAAVAMALYVVVEVVVGMRRRP